MPSLFLHRVGLVFPFFASLCLSLSLPQAHHVIHGGQRLDEVEHARRMREEDAREGERGRRKEREERKGVDFFLSFSIDDRVFFFFFFLRCLVKMKKKYLVQSFFSSLSRSVSLQPSVKRKRL